MGKIISLTASFLSGFVFLSFEIYWVRIFSFASKSRPWVFGLIVGIYLTGLALGALAVKVIYLRKTTHNKDNTTSYLFLAASASAYLVIPLTVWLQAHFFYAYRFGLIPLAVTTFLAGGIFPMLVHEAGISEKDAGTGVSLLSAVNITGSLAGSLITGFWLLDILPLAQASAITSLTGLAASLICFNFKSGQHKKIFFFTLLVLIGAGTMTGNGLLHKEMYKKLMYMPRHVVIPPFKEIVENRSGIICLTEDGVLFGDGAYDGRLGTELYPKINSEIEMAYLSFLFKPDARRILVIGMASGAWTKVLAAGSGVERVTAIEINPGYLEIIENSPEVSDLLTNPLVDIVIDDGRRWLNRNPAEKFDYIVLNTTFHWRSGATNLLSLEFLNLIKTHLNPGGVVLLNTTGSKEAAATAFSVFSHQAAYSIYLALSDTPFSLDRELFSETIKNFRINNEPVLDLSDPEEAETLGNYLKMDYLKEGLKWKERSCDAGIITDDNMITEFGRKH